MINQLELIDRAKSVLGKDILQELISWYTEISSSNGYRYIVFLSQRSYNLGILCEKITGIKMVDREYTEYLTDSAMYIRCEELVKEYRGRKSFPRILICSDIVSTAKDINHYLESLEEELIRLLPNEESKEIRYALVNATTIQTYVRSNKQLLLLPRFELNFDCMRKVDAKEQHQLECNIQYLLQTSCINTQPWLYSYEITEDKFKELESNSEFIHTKYMNMHEYTKIEFIKYSSNIQAILTLRVIKSSNVDTYKVIPMVLLPNLSEAETTILLRKIVNKIELQEEDKNYILKLINTPGKRALNELITLIISNSLMQESNIILGGMQREEELDRIVRNYNLLGYKKTKEFLSKIIGNKALNINEIKDILSTSITQHNISLIGYEGIWDDKRVRERVENYFYSNIADEEKAVYLSRQQQYRMLIQSSERRIRGCNFVIKELVEGYNENTIKSTVAYLLQLLDAGIISISSYASNKVNVVGFGQFIKVEEQALFILPLNNYIYIPLLCEIERHVWYTGNKDVVQSFKKYILANTTDLTDKEIDSIINFINTIKSLGQDIVDWDGNYMRIIQANNSLGIKDQWGYINKQYEYLKEYNKYKRETEEY